MQAVLDKFQPRFIPKGRILWTNETSEKTGPISRGDFSELGLPSAVRNEFPNVAIQDRTRRLLVLVDIARLRGLITTRRRETLELLFSGREFQLILVNAFASRREFQGLFVELPWQTYAWFANEPKHVIYFSGACSQLETGRKPVLR